MKPATRSSVLTLITALPLLLASRDAGSIDAASRQYRLVAPGTASVSAIAATPVNRAYLVGGAGQVVGISASASVSIVAGATSNGLPTARIFRNGMEG